MDLFSPFFCFCLETLQARLSVLRFDGVDDKTVSLVPFPYIRYTSS